MPRIVVAMAAKNAATTICLAAKSTLDALPLDAQLVVWDDGSRDETVQAVEKIPDSRLVVMRSLDSLGSGRARQAVFEATDSDLFANMDADDYSFRWRFRRLDLQEADVEFSPAINFEPMAKLRPSRPTALNPQEAATALLLHNPFYHSSMLARRSILSHVGGYRDLPYAQDYDLWLRLAVTGARIVRNVVPLIAYRRSSEQVSQRPDYEFKVHSDPRLATSHAELFRRALSQRHQHLLNGRDVENLPLPTLRRALEGEITAMRSFHRRYYRKLLRKRLWWMTE